MIIRKENSEKTVKSILYITLFSLFFSLPTFGQDSIPAQKDLNEEAELKFQEYFFKALSQKAIGNHQKALENLESCNQILPENQAVFFEFSKNYLALNNSSLAKEYINRALLKESDNIWMLKHLVKIYQRENSFTEAIATQKKVIEINPKEVGSLLRLYLFDRDYDNALLLLKELEEDKKLTPSLRKIQNQLKKRMNKVVVNNPKKPQNLTLLELFTAFEKEKTYTILKQLLNKAAKENKNILLKYSSEGLVLFPAQPFVYLMQARALNYQKNYKKALSTLNNGIDFVLEDEMEASFYEEMSISYQNLGDIKQSKKFLEKAKKLKI